MKGYAAFKPITAIKGIKDHQEKEGVSQDWMATKAILALSGTSQMQHSTVHLTNVQQASLPCL